MFNPNTYFIIVETPDGPVMGRLVGNQGLVADIHSDEILVRNYNDWFLRCKYFTRSAQVEHAEDVPVGETVTLTGVRFFVVKSEEISKNEGFKCFCLTLAR